MARKTAGDGSTTLTADMRVVVLHGSDTYLLRERARQLAAALEERFGGLERFQFDGESVDLATLLDELRSYGLMQRHKLVILDNADEFLAEKDSHRPALEAYAKSPMPDATLLMRGEGWRPGNLDKAIAAVGAIIKCDAPSDAKAMSWCRERCARRYQCTIDDDAAQLLVARTGPDLARLDTELAKMAAFVGPGQAISAAIVGQMTQPTREEQAWAIHGALVSGSAVQALARLEELLDVSRLDPLFVLWAVSDLVRKLHTASQMLRQGEPAASINRQCKLWPPDGPRILAAAQRGEPRRFARLLQQAIDTEHRCKSGQADPRRGVESLTVLVADSIGSAPLQGASRAPAGRR